VACLRNFPRKPYQFPPVTQITRRENFNLLSRGLQLLLTRCERSLELFQFRKGLLPSGRCWGRGGATIWLGAMRG
jgi:hypothetical protein